MGIRWPTDRRMRAARFSPMVMPSTRDAIRPRTTAPTMATVAYTGRKPDSGMEITSAIQSSTLSTTVEPMPLVAIITPTSVPGIPSAVNSWYPIPALPTVPAGMTCATAAADRSMRNSLDRLGRPSGGSRTRFSSA